MQLRYPSESLSTDSRDSSPTASLSIGADIGLQIGIESAVLAKMLDPIQYDPFLMQEVIFPRTIPRPTGFQQWDDLTWQGSEPGKLIVKKKVPLYMIQSKVPLLGLALQNPHEFVYLSNCLAHPVTIPLFRRLDNLSLSSLALSSMVSLIGTSLWHQSMMQHFGWRDENLVAKMHSVIWKDASLWLLCRVSRAASGKWLINLFWCSTTHISDQNKCPIGPPSEPHSSLCIRVSLMWQTQSLLSLMFIYSSCGKSHVGLKDSQDPMFFILPTCIVEHAFPAKVQLFTEQCTKVIYFCNWLTVPMF